MTDNKPAPKSKLAPGEFENEKLGCKFSLPEPFKMRDVERYEEGRDAAREAGAATAFAINWIGAAAIVENWKCETLPDPAALTPGDFAESHGAVMQVIVWVASTVNAYVIEKLFIPKN